jgi:tetratricopeptide (TPR) repeat protein
MRVDKRFDKLRRADPGAFDVKQASATSLARAEDRVHANPKRLQPIAQLLYVMLKTRQTERALHIADEVIANAGDGHGKELYDDFGEYYPWIIDVRATTLWQLGRWDEAVTQQRHAARYPEHGELNVSQALNLSSYYAQLGRVDDALDATSDLGVMSPYGRMQLEAVGVIGAVQRGDAAGIATHLDYMRIHRGDSLSTYQSALLDANRLDEAADLLVERLRNLAWRADALAEIQIYVDTPMTPLVQTREARRRAMIATASVRRALAKVGRIEKVPLTF